MFEKYPFEKLNDLLKDIEVENEILYNLTIGEPQFDTPLFIQEELKKHTHLLNKYPKSRGEDQLINAQIDFIKRRFDIKLSKEYIIPTFGTREVLFNLPLFLRPKKVAFPNPFYQIYEGSSIAVGAEINYMLLDKSNNFINNISQLKGDEDLVIINSPNNPTGSIIEFDTLCEWVEEALRKDFVIISDECYSEIYTNNKVPSILEASLAVGNKNFKNVLSINSISKRSSAPSLRSGYIAGDKNILKDYMNFRTYVGCASPLPLQYAAAKAWSDDKHVEVFRKKYKENLELAKEILNVNVPEATFYIWLEVDDDLRFTKEAYKKGVKVMPGRFMGRNSAGEGFVRIALVYEKNILEKPLKILKGILNDSRKL